MKLCDQDNYFHDLLMIVDTAEVVTKVCTRCKMKWDFTKDPKGRVDNALYQDIHIRHYIQPGSRYFEREYGKPKSLRYNEDKMRDSENHNRLEEQMEEAEAHEKNVFL